MKEEKRAEITDKYDSTLIENGVGCEYDIDNCECLATGCQRYGLCVFTQSITAPFGTTFS